MHRGMELARCSSQIIVTIRTILNTISSRRVADESTEDTLFSEWRLACLLGRRTPSYIS